MGFAFSESRFYRSKTLLIKLKHTIFSYWAHLKQVPEATCHAIKQLPHQRQVQIRVSAT
eukprot:c45213_g1_i1 orf=91-267(+)